MSDPSSDSGRKSVLAYAGRSEAERRGERERAKGVGEKAKGV